MKIYTPPKSTTLLWQIRIGVMSTVFAVVLFLVANFFSLGFNIIAVAECILIFAGILVVFAYIPAYFKAYSIELSKNALIIKSGVFLRSQRIMPEPRMIYTESYHTPLSKMLGLSGLMLRASRAATFCAELSAKDKNEILKEMER